MSRQALGRGLRALIPESATSRPEGGRLREVAIGEVAPNPYQPRREFADDELQELAASIRAHGVLEPVVVRPVVGREPVRYELVVGERRWRAAQLAGLTSLPAVVRPVEDREMLQMALVENLQREDLNPLEEAEAYRRLMDEFGLSQDDVAQAVGRKRPTVANTLRLLELEPEIREALRAGRLSAGHGKALLAAPPGRARVELAQRVLEAGLSVRETEGLARQLAQGREATGVGRAGGGHRRPAASDESERRWSEVEAALERALGTRVVIREGRRKGRIEIEFYGEEDLVRLVELLGQVDDRVAIGGLR
ncbi:ParB/RepB/Spo0J family partition protein [Geochorda subterranea]|uniref:ParB/RepB/Spo0J family partition protein n=1 Tax=Geochorda subterranea TaxID=3109564 RepID=A0ABZ1BPM2_9FIRM|nr:ParB/RepB/Spo0J family partition protein [Limnochorda sp. LNt]WRP14654.1 ParB/RepB/Spo0J family partition protein [Limnochorda sp. LNt]